MQGYAYLRRQVGIGKLSLTIIKYYIQLIIHYLVEIILINYNRAELVLKVNHVLFINLFIPYFPLYNSI